MVCSQARCAFGRKAQQSTGWISGSSVVVATVCGARNSLFSLSLGEFRPRHSLMPRCIPHCGRSAPRPIDVSHLRDTGSLPGMQNPKRRTAFSRRFFFFGGRNRTRTCDPIDVNDVLYRLSHGTKALRTECIIAPGTGNVNPQNDQKSIGAAQGRIEKGCLIESRMRRDTATAKRAGCAEGIVQKKKEKALLKSAFCHGR